jgi:hypothetical protein
MRNPGTGEQQCHNEEWNVALQHKNSSTEVLNENAEQKNEETAPRGFHCHNGILARGLRKSNP